MTAFMAKNHEKTPERERVAPSAASDGLMAAQLQAMQDRMAEAQALAAQKEAAAEARMQSFMAMMMQQAHAPQASASASSEARARHGLFPEAQAFDPSDAKYEWQKDHTPRRG